MRLHFQQAKAEKLTMLKREAGAARARLSARGSSGGAPEAQGRLSTAATRQRDARKLTHPCRNRLKLPPRAHLNLHLGIVVRRE
jgi:hypothetical protein